MTRADRSPTPNKSTEYTPKNRRKILFRLTKYLYAYKLYILLALILTFTSNILSLIGPSLAGSAIDAFGTSLGQVNFPKVFGYIITMLILYGFSALLSYLLAILMIQLSQKVVYKMRKDVFDRLADLPVGYFDQHQTGDIISRVTYDIDTINTSLSNDVIQIFTSLITVVGSLTMMIIISPQLVLVFLLTIPASIAFTRFMTQKTKPLFRKRSGKLGELNGFVEEVISGQKVIKAYHQEDVMIERFDIKNDEAVEAFYNAEYYSSTVGPTINFINNLSLSLVSVFGAILYLLGQLTIGNVSSFVLYSRKFSGPINELANIISELQSSLAAAERVFKVIDEIPEKEDAIDAINMSEVELKGNITIENLTFGYNDEKIIIDNLNLQAKSGDLIAIVGPTGAGKTTIINLLMRFYDPQSGKISIDGHDIKSVTRKSLRQSFAMVLQDTWLFQGTIYENIAYGKPNTTLEDVIKVAKAAKIHNYITHLPNGYETLLNEEGINISQGQKQLLTIARAMLLDAKMLILDEATSNVDTRTELQIQEAMYDLMKGKTSFVIAHRLSTIQNADTILVVNNGLIVEHGKHTDLLSLKGLYAEMYYSQFSSQN
ncbi:ABC transporter ATP-binding protein [Fusibacter bizertensis]|uniref:ABC transporter ATP-binding protein n=1 Tax=Fusibacter bizertensis TaxID=1488331 RepID=A0ABT6NCZ7_9FIRM|nr:ABC transporter ATP-binding protein [Fusibacter bizertensis]MDH8678305.1 ABC transporter ATP-binding protein [Fusibacter bizertensis]